ncbi:MAG: hypothetical protein COV01_03825 [Candidatus Taylorbacteria bacterium CG10_big_fil_rev_8_21_14_0_10_41_48]|uniref:Uncharacterized protein n=1 Tax=Candidatus Taylorbacteria bacterium CG10_big_fil_rev_8_21_14_0_10_41_48 TaxID=1975024 RepID=A0A2M8LBD1_9BACT|nr:MAG: hypothetical protein COV01_03825 [Candidatus Taylorbacteria bacterium CG10_big_fil_rev_8_21_14_0_10_41_48]
MNNRTLISIFLIVGFSTLAVFGAFAMGQSIGGQNACIAATASGLDCLTPSNLASIASMYLGAFGTFSSAIFFTLSLLALFVTAFITAKNVFSQSFSFVSVSINDNDADITRSLSLRPALSWIAIHENSPSRR